MSLENLKGKAVSSLVGSIVNSSLGDFSFTSVNCLNLHSRVNESSVKVMVLMSSVTFKKFSGNGFNSCQ